MGLITLTVCWRVSKSLGLVKLTAPQQREMPVVLKDRHERRSTLVVNQFPGEH